MEYMLMPLKRYADFSGRSRRKEYWMFTLGVLICYLVFALLLAVSGAFSGMENGEGPGALGMIVFALLGIFGLGLIVPSLAVAVRRFHDQDKSGWFILLGLIPYVGGIINIVFMCIEGTKGPNRFGDDPKAAENIGDVFR